ncbi:MAG: Unknown protein [uncultured Campylobacterales bacterium]|uniref:Uncharacterized protein n=1 Tax=uncultured Campylobacterales bacterium TaxID=352960 RepID=A0A6S6T077_9BACT|nr:MAG: Unknown protein [uncultured Campylobacterales bacterium]
MDIVIIGFTSDVVLNYFLSIMVNISVPVIGSLALISFLKGA